MDRLEYSSCSLLPNESVVESVSPTRLYDGDKRTGFENGELTLTTHRLFWGKIDDFKHQNQCIALPLKLVVLVESEAAISNPLGSIFGGNHSFKIVLHLEKPANDRNPGPVSKSEFDFIKISLKSNCEAFTELVEKVVNERKWEKTISRPTGPVKVRSGIGGIQRSLEEKQRVAHENINVAFQDLQKLMSMTKDMVTLSKQVSAKIQSRQSEFTEDETIRFRSYLMSFGIDDPVTRTGTKSHDEYVQKLAHEVHDIMTRAMQESRGMVTLTDAYCIVNRARGMELISPDDLWNACKALETISNSSMFLARYESGVCVLQSKELSTDAIVASILNLLDGKDFVTANDLALLDGVSVLLAKQRLLVCERQGKVCRDETVEGLRFYKNKFLV